MTKSRFSFCALSFMALALLTVPSGCSVGSTSKQSSDLLSQSITPENVSEISKEARTGLSYDEYRLVLDYLKRMHPELPSGQLPTGLTLGTMIQSQRDFEASGVGRAEASKSTTSAESPPKVAAKVETSPATPPAATPPADAEQPSTTPPADVPAPPTQPATEVLRKGTPLKVRLDQAISSKQNQDGDLIKATLEDNLVVDGKLLAPEGSKVVGRLSNVKASGKVQGRATLSVALTSIEVGQKVYEIRTNTLAFEAQGTAKADATKVGIGAGVGAVIGAIAGGGKGAAIGGAIGAGAGTGVVLVTTGKEVEFEVEQLFSFQLDQDLELPVAKGLNPDPRD